MKKEQFLSLLQAFKKNYVTSEVIYLFLRNFSNDTNDLGQALLEELDKDGELLQLFACSLDIKNIKEMQSIGIELKEELLKKILNFFDKNTDFLSLKLQDIFEILIDHNRGSFLELDFLLKWFLSLAKTYPATFKFFWQENMGKGNWAFNNLYYFICLLNKYQLIEYHYLFDLFLNEESFFERHVNHVCQLLYQDYRVNIFNEDQKKIFLAKIIIIFDKNPANLCGSYKSIYLNLTSAEQEERFVLKLLQEVQQTSELLLKKDCLNDICDVLFYYNVKRKNVLLIENQLVRFDSNNYLEFMETIRQPFLIENLIKADINNIAILRKYIKDGSVENICLSLMREDNNFFKQFLIKKKFTKKNKIFTCYMKQFGDDLFNKLVGFLKEDRIFCRRIFENISVIEDLKVFFPDKSQEIDSLLKELFIDDEIFEQIAHSAVTNPWNTKMNVVAFVNAYPFNREECGIRLIAYFRHHPKDILHLSSIKYFLEIFPRDSYWFSSDLGNIIFNYLNKHPFSFNKQELKVLLKLFPERKREITAERILNLIQEEPLTDLIENAITSDDIGFINNLSSLILDRKLVTTGDRYFRNCLVLFLNNVVADQQDSISEEMTKALMRLKKALIKLPPASLLETTILFIASKNPISHIHQSDLPDEVKERFNYLPSANLSHGF